MVCNVWRSAVQSPNSASATTAVTAIPEARTCRTNVRARRHFSWNTTVDGMRPRARCAGVNHVAGRYSAPTNQACTPVHSAAVTATWQLPILPNVPEYWRLTPTDARPCLGKPVPSSTRMPARAGIAARTRRHTASAFQSASVMKYCSA